MRERGLAGLGLESCWICGFLGFRDFLNLGMFWMCGVPGFGDFLDLLDLGVSVVWGCSWFGGFLIYVVVGDLWISWIWGYYGFGDFLDLGIFKSRLCFIDFRTFPSISRIWENTISFRKK